MHVRLPLQILKKRIKRITAGEYKLAILGQLHMKYWIKIAAVEVESGSTRDTNWPLHNPGSSVVVRRTELIASGTAVII